VKHFLKIFGAAACLMIFMGLMPRVSAAKQVSLLIIDTDSYLVNEALKTLKLLPAIKVAYFTYDDLIHHAASEKFVKDSDVLIVDVMDSRLSRYAARHIDMKKVPVYAIRGSRDDAVLKQQGYRFDREIQTYFANLSPGNIQNMLYRVIHQTLDASVSAKPPDILPAAGIYHPAAHGTFSSFSGYRKWYQKSGHYRANGPWVGIMVFKSSLGIGQNRPLQVITQRLEANGFNVAVVFGRAENALKFLLGPEGKAQVALILAFSMKFQSSLNKTVKNYLKRLDIPVFNAISLYSQTIKAWRKDPKGIPPLDAVWCMANPEMSGQIEPTPLIGKLKLKEPKTGRIFYVHKIIPDTLEALIARMKKWLVLQRKPNQKKRVAILFYNHSQGKQNIGASYLNVFKSIQVILKRMRREGYQIAPARRLTQKTIRGVDPENREKHRELGAGGA